MLPLDDLVKKDGVDPNAFDSSMIKGLSADNKLYALPYDVGPVMMFFNKDRFEAAGLPEPKAGWTADEFVAASKKLATSGKPAIAPSTADIFIESQVLAYNGGRVLKEDGTMDAANEDFAKGLQWVSDLTGKEKVSPQLPGGDPAFSSNEFLSGNTAMHIDGPWSLLDTKAQGQVQGRRDHIARRPRGRRDVQRRLRLGHLQAVRHSGQGLCCPEGDDG